jgi:hypothetical protein
MSTSALKSVCSGLAALVLFSALPVFGSTITVTNTTDNSPNSLRDAIARAADGDTINFNLPLPNTITVNSPLTIDSSQDKSITISGPGASLLAISGGDSVAVFVIQPLFGQGGRISATISRVSIEHGNSNLGAGVYNGGTLSLIDCVVSTTTWPTSHRRVSAAAFSMWAS